MESTYKEVEDIICKRLYVFQLSYHDICEYMDRDSKLLTIIKRISKRKRVK